MISRKKKNWCTVVIWNFKIAIIKMRNVHRLFFSAFFSSIFSKGDSIRIDIFGPFNVVHRWRAIWFSLLIFGLNIRVAQLFSWKLRFIRSVWLSTIHIDTISFWIWIGYKWWRRRGGRRRWWWWRLR